MKPHELMEALAAQVKAAIDARFAGLDARLKKFEEAPAPVAKDGRDGKDGAPGRDAAQLSVHRSIDEEHSYAPGTWAAHKGGLWVSRSQTRGMEGWECIVNGVAGVEFEQTSEREWVARSMLSDGTETRKSFNAPVVIDRGVYKDGKDYEQGDACTWGGSLWIAQTKTNKRPGEGEQDWRLAVKRGRDGKGVPVRTRE